MQWFGSEKTSAIYNDEDLALQIDGLWQIGSVRVEVAIIIRQNNSDREKKRIKNQFLADVGAIWEGL